MSGRDWYYGFMRRAVEEAEVCDGDLQRSTVHSAVPKVAVREEIAGPTESLAFSSRESRFSSVSN